LTPQPGHDTVFKQVEDGPKEEIMELEADKKEFLVVTHEGEVTEAFPAAEGYYFVIEEGILKICQKGSSRIGPVSAYAPGSWSEAYYEEFEV
jgi:hypothetical protein